MDRHYIQVALICMVAAVVNGETAKTVQSVSTDRAIDEVVIMETIPRGEPLRNVIKHFMNEHPGKEVFRLAIYKSEEDARLTEARKLGPDLDYSAWREKAMPATEFVRIGNRAVIRQYDGKRLITSSITGFEPLAEFTCRGVPVRFLYLAMARYTPAMRLSVDTFFMYEGRFSVRDAKCLAKDLGIQRLGIGSVNIAARPSFPLQDDYPYFNRFIDPGLYSLPENSPDSRAPQYFCSKLAKNVKLNCGKVDVLGFGK